MLRPVLAAGRLIYVPDAHRYDGLRHRAPLSGPATLPPDEPPYAYFKFLVPYVIPAMLTTTAQLIATGNLHTRSVAERWQIIAQIDQEIDHFQKCQKVLHNNGLSYASIAADLRSLRAKRMQIWLSFKPEIGTHVRLATV